MTLTTEQAAAVYDVLVEECGASNEGGRTDFVWTQTHQDVNEYRFMGALGFGGKFWRSHGEWYVTCYPEDATAERNSMIEAANRRLGRVREPEQAS